MNKALDENDYEAMKNCIQVFQDCIELNEIDYTIAINTMMFLAVGGLFVETESLEKSKEIINNYVDKLWAYDELAKKKHKA